VSHEKPFSQACENNRRPILEVLRRYLGDGGNVLEIGSGTGQHAVFFGAALPDLVWQCSDLPASHVGIRRWLEDAGLPNVRPPLTLDVTTTDWTVGAVDAVFSANTAHIMHWPAVCAMFAGVGRILPPGGPFLLYGPFARGGRHTSESNARFDLSLRAADPGMGVRDLDDLAREAEAAGLRLEADWAMPANNRLLVWRRSGPGEASRAAARSRPG
jgi:cyclopropane fatty-acyl-phospholipid synthase-like methyltransferase